MKYTSAEANKLLREKNDMLRQNEKKEDLSSEFIVSLGEDPESVRPEYDYAAAQSEMNRLAKKSAKSSMPSIFSMQPQWFLTLI